MNEINEVAASAAEEPVKFFFENEEEKAMGIETATYPNGNIVKRVKLSDGREAIVRELTGKDMKRSDIIAGGKQENAIPALMSLSTKIDGFEIPMEDYDRMKAKDYAKIKFATTLLNF